MSKAAENFLDFIPRQNPEFPWRIKEDNGRVEVTMQNVGVFNRIAQVCFRRPKVSYIELDEYGTFVWQKIDGAKTVFDISQEVEKQFGKDAEPLLRRLIHFFGILHDHKFITYEKRS